MMIDYTSSFGQPGLRWSAMSSAVSFIPVKYLEEQKINKTDENVDYDDGDGEDAEEVEDEKDDQDAEDDEDDDLTPRSVTKAGPLSRSSFNLFFRWVFDIHWNCRSHCH